MPPVADAKSPAVPVAKSPTAPAVAADSVLETHRCEGVTGRWQCDLLRALIFHKGYKLTYYSLQVAARANG